MLNARLKPLFPLSRFSEERQVLVIGVLAVLYYLVAHWSLQVSFNNTNASPVWPAAGLGFITILVFGYRAWPAIWMGAFFANFTFLLGNHTSQVPVAILISVPIAAGNMLEAMLSVFLMRSFVDAPNPLLSVRDIFKFVFAVFIGCLSSAAIGTLIVCLSGQAPGALSNMVFFTWWLGDVVGILTLVPLFWTFYMFRWQKPTHHKVIEAAAVAIILVTVEVVVFSAQFVNNEFSVAGAYLILPLAVWSAYRFGYVGATLSTVVTMAIAVFGTLHQLGPFVSNALNASLIAMQSFLGIISVTALVLAAALQERRKAEEKMRRSEERFRGLVENSMDMIALLSTSATVLYASPSTQRILGYTIDEQVGHNIFEWIHPDDILGITDVLQKIMDVPGAIVEARCRFRHKDGSWRWLEGTGYNLLADPAIEAVVVNYRDITDREKARMAIEESEHRFRSMADTAPVMVWVTGTDGLCTFLNKAWIDFTGRSLEHELGCGRLQGIHPQDRERTENIYLDAFQSRKKFTMDYRLLRFDGVYRWVVDTGVPRFTADGDFAGMIGSCLDITERKRAEQVLVRDKESLENLVDERSKELIKAQKELKHASRLADIGTLAATVAHELRNPLGVIQLAAHNLSKQKGDAVPDRHLVNIQKKVWEGNQIIDNLLSYSRIKIPNYEEVQVLSMLDECLGNVQGRFHEKNIIVEKEYDKTLGNIEADGLQVREILANILNNAYQAIPGQEGRIKVGASREGECVKICIEDNGSGIAEADLDKIFDPFFTRKSKGTGLGLSICNELVQLHQGKIVITSRPGEGTTVCVTLPIQRKNDETRIDH